VTLGKCLAGGASPAGAVVLSQDLVDELRDKSWQTYSTFRAHPVAVACIRAYLRVVKRDDLLSRSRVMAQKLEKDLIAIAQKHRSVARVDGFGLHWTIELHGPDWRNWYADTIEPPIASRVAARALEAGAVIGTSGEETSLFLCPPMVTSDQEIDELLQALDHGLELADAEYAKSDAA
jgi:4-aminobutyrate aminotransferase-like enzyme